jgi:SH3-like domain-containing protein
MMPRLEPAFRLSAPFGLAACAVTAAPANALFEKGRPAMCLTRRLVLIGCLVVATPILAVAANTAALIKAEQSVTLRADASAKAESIETLLRFQPVVVLDRKEASGHSWARVKTVKADPNKSATGWVPASCLTSCGYAMVDDDQSNVRRGPGSQYDVIMHYGRNYPIQPLDVASNGWVKERDCDGDMGWIWPKSLRLDDPHVITSGSTEPYNVREGIGTSANVKFRAAKGYLMKALEEKDGWLHVKDADNEDGWISAKIVFGWLDPPSLGDSRQGETKASQDKTNKTSKAARTTKTSKASAANGKNADASKAGKTSSKKRSSSAPKD